MQLQVTVKPAYNGTATDRNFSVAGLILFYYGYLEFVSSGTANVFRWRNILVTARLLLRQVSVYMILWWAFSLQRKWCFYDVKSLNEVVQICTKNRSICIIMSQNQIFLEFHYHLPLYMVSGTHIITMQLVATIFYIMTLHTCPTPLIHVQQSAKVHT